MILVSSHDSGVCMINDGTLKTRWLASKFLLSRVSSLPSMNWRKIILAEPGKRHRRLTRDWIGVEAW